MQEQPTRDLLSPPQTSPSKRGNVTCRDTLSHSLLSPPARHRSGIVTHGDTISSGLLSPIAFLSSERGNVTRGDTLSHSLLSPPAFSHSGIVTRGDTIFPGLLSPQISSLASAAATTGDPSAPVYPSPQFALDHASLFSTGGAQRGLAYRAGPAGRRHRSRRGRQVVDAQAFLSNARLVAPQPSVLGAQ